MLNLYWTIIMSFVCATVCVAQTNYYAETKTFNESNYTYKAEVSSHGYVKLYNTANLWMNTESVYKDTGTIFNMPDYGIDLFDDDSWLDSKKQVANVVNSSFSNTEKQRIQDVYFFIIMHINSTTATLMMYILNLITRSLMLLFLFPFIEI